MLERSKALQIYFKPGLKEDDVMLRVWQAAKRNARAQEIFRDMLREGLVALVANGTMPESIIEECGLDAIVERRRRRTAKHADRQAAAAPQPQPMPPYGYAPYPGYPAPQAYPQHEAPVYAPPAQARQEAPVFEPAPAPQPSAPAAQTAPVAPAQTLEPARPPRREVQQPAKAEDGAPRPERKLGKLM